MRGWRTSAESTRYDAMSKVGSASMTVRDEAVPKRRWRIACLLGFGVMVNYVDRVNLSVSQSALYTDFGISVIAFGYLSSAYNWTYALLQLPVGVWLDRFGVRRVGRFSILIWSFASFAAALAQGMRGFFGARLLLGVGEAPTFPSNAKAIALWFPERERGLPTAVFDASAKLAPAIGVPFLGLLIVHFGWRMSFAATGVLSLLYFGLFYLLYRDPADDAGLSVQELQYIEEGTRGAVSNGRVETGASLSDLLKQKKVLGMALGMGAYNYSFYLLLAWLPSYLSVMHHVDLLHSAFYTAIPWVFATVVALVIGGWMVDQLIRRGWNANHVRRWVLIGGTVCGLGLVGAGEVRSTTAALLWISLSLGGLSVASPVLWSVPGLIVSRGSVGRVGGIANFWGQVSAISAPILTGYTVAHTHSFATAFQVAGGYLLIGIASYVFLLGRLERTPDSDGIAS